MSLTDFSEIVEGWQTLCLSPTEYEGEINIDDIDSNDPEKILGIKQRWFGNMSNRLPSSAYDTMEVAEHLYAKPVELIKVKVPIVCGDKNRRIHVEAGDYCSYSRGFAGIGDLIFRRHAQLEIGVLLQRGELIISQGPDTIVRALQGHKIAKISPTHK